MQYKCDQCDKYFATKAKRNRHIKRVHEKGEAAENAEENPGGGENQTLQIAPPADTPKTPGGYTCNGCGAELSKGQDPCPNCGEPMNWEGIE